MPCVCKVYDFMWLILTFCVCCMHEIEQRQKFVLSISWPRLGMHGAKDHEQIKRYRERKKERLE